MCLCESLDWDIVIIIMGYYILGYYTINFKLGVGYRGLYTGWISLSLSCEQVLMYNADYIVGA